MTSLVQAKECKLYEGAATINQDPFEKTPSFIFSSPKLEKLHNANGASVEPISHDGVRASDSEGISNVGNGGKVINSQQIVLTCVSTGTEEYTINGTSPTRSSLTHLIYEDSSVPGAAALSSPVTTSSHIAYSGNLSLRSDSSTTSTHSFAFPILQSEWNNSPVKMVKANRRRSWKHRWRAAFICCKY